jgi:hypothetical protein
VVCAARWQEGHSCKRLSLAADGCRVGATTRHTASCGRQHAAPPLTRWPWRRKV